MNLAPTEQPVRRRSESSYRAKVTDGKNSTTNNVVVLPEDVSRYESRHDPPERLLEASFEFLLERERWESILPISSCRSSSSTSPTIREESARSCSRFAAASSGLRDHL